MNRFCECGSRISLRQTPTLRSNIGQKASLDYEWGALEVGYGVTGLCCEEFKILLVIF